MLSLRLNSDREALVTVTLSSGGFRKTNHAMPPDTAAAMKMIVKVMTSFWFRFMAETKIKSWLRNFQESTEHKRRLSHIFMDQRVSYVLLFIMW